jgi:hypothetical protein
MANGDITYTNPGGQSINKALSSGLYIGSGAELNIIVGFQPSKIVLHNDTDDTEFVWFAGMAAGTMFQYTSAGAKTMITGGPTVYAGADGEGFTVPTTAVLNTAADLVYWEAYR